MPLTQFIKHPRHAFDQNDVLKALGPTKVPGLCLALSSTFIHLRRQGLDPEDILPFLRESTFRDRMAQAMLGYIAHGRDFGDIGVYIELHQKTLDDLVAQRKAEPGLALLLPLGETKPDSRVPLKLQLFNHLPRGQKPLALLGFDLRGGGGHAIVVDGTQRDWGIFDPNFGWMQLRNGFNDIDLGLVLRMFESEYAVTAFGNFQDITRS